MIQKVLAWLNQTFGPGGYYITELGVKIHVRANGTTYVDSEELRKALDKYEADLKLPVQEAPCGCCVPDPCYGSNRCVGKS